MIRRCYMAEYADGRPRHCISVDEAPGKNVLYNGHVDLDLPEDLDPKGSDAELLRIYSEAYVKGKQEARQGTSGDAAPQVRPVTLDELYARVDHFAARDDSGEDNASVLSMALHYITDADAQEIVADAARKRIANSATV